MNRTPHSSRSPSARRCAALCADIQRRASRTRKISPSPRCPSSARPGSLQPLSQAQRRRGRRARRHHLRAPCSPDPDAGIVTYVPSAANELPIGTIIKVRMNQTFDSSTARRRHALHRLPLRTRRARRQGHHPRRCGDARHRSRTSTAAHASSAAPRCGSRPTRSLLPDGSHYIINAQVIDTDQFRKPRIDANGAIVHSAHVKSKSAVMTVTAGSGALVGAAFGGAPGALIGASIGASLTTVHWLRQDKRARLPVEVTRHLQPDHLHAHDPASLKNSQPVILSGGGECLRPFF